MNCMRCGKECQGNDVFCPECLEQMEQNPVKPGTVIQLPVRQTEEARRIKKKREIPLEEQVASLRKTAKLLTRWILILILALAVAVSLLVHDWLQPEKKPTSDKNYITSAMFADEDCFT